MKYKVFTVHDAKAEAYLKPFLMRTKGEAIRAMQDLANDPKHDFSKYSEDYTLFEIGTYDDEQGNYEMLNVKISLGNGLEFKNTTSERTN